MATTGKIDRELWEKCRVIFSQDLINSLSDAYRQRRNKIITSEQVRALFAAELSTGKNDNSVNINGNVLNSGDNTHGAAFTAVIIHKGKERKGYKESIEKGETPVLKPDKPKKKNKTPLPPDFKISDRVVLWATQRGVGNLDQHLEGFLGKCKAKGYEYVDWDEALMNAIRYNWAGLANGSKAPRKSSDPFTICPACKREVLKTDITDRGCLHCEQRSGSGREALTKIMASIGGEAHERGP